MALDIKIDRDACMGSGNCSFWAPGVFDLDDEGIAVVVDATAMPDDKIVLAAQGCPTQAIAIFDGDTKVVERRASTMTPIVLVHGGAHGAWCWEPTEPLLRADALSVDLPPVSIRRGPSRHEIPAGIENVHVADWAAAVIAAADARGFERFVLVGHSLGGLTIAEVARQAPARVAHLVFVSALVPPEGGRAIDAMSPEFMAKFAGGLTEALIREMFCSDFTEEQVQFELDHIGTEVNGVMTELVSRAGIPASIPKVYVRLARDQSLELPMQDASIARLRRVPGGDVETIDIDAGHMVMISQPAVLAATLDEIAARPDASGN